MDSSFKRLSWEAVDDSRRYTVVRRYIWEACRQCIAEESFCEGHSKQCGFSVLYSSVRKCNCWCGLPKMAKFLAMWAICAIVCGLVTLGSGHTYKTGECPTVEPMSGFNMQQFLGVWYVIQKTGTASSCVIYNVTKTDEPGEYDIEQVSQRNPLSVGPLKHEYSYTGKLTVTDKDVPARMTVRFPLSVAGSAKFVVFMSDYNTFAGVYSCQKIPFGHRQSATILSRTRELDRIYVDKIRNRLSSFSVDPFDLSIIDQTGCPKEGEAGFNIHIDSNTFSTKNIANVFRKAGEKIGDGFEYAVNAGKKVTHLF